ncbi:zinc finger protein 436-like [Cydia fagiglandana]|uniref:zinc finger protein 436-like n=1 Tax=Cydia fagiglandana TaxID=1458189 RepID=UPI002FEE1FCA
MYADDVAAIVTAPNGDGVEKALNEAAAQLAYWFRTNGLALNLKKTHFMQFNLSGRQAAPLAVEIDGTLLEQTTATAFLGFEIDSGLKWDRHTCLCVPIGVNSRSNLALVAHATTSLPAVTHRISSVSGMETLHSLLLPTSDMHTSLLIIYLQLTLLGDDDGICEVCVGRLRDASDFKLQVQCIQAELHARLKGTLHVKEELPSMKSEESDDGEEAEPLIHLEVKVEGSQDPLPNDGNQIFKDFESVTKMEVEYNKPETKFTKRKQLAKEELVSSDEALPASQPCPATSQCDPSPASSVEDAPAHTPAVSADPQPYTCDTCHKQFAKKLNLINHMKVHNKGKIYSCEVCNSEFKRFKQLVVHKRVHKGEKPFSCEICNKRFRETSSLIVHNRIHTGEKPYSCEICNKRFTQKRCLLSHKLTHVADAAKAYTCSVCNKGFTQKGNLVSHTRVHTREKPFHCEICKKQFGQQSSLIHHTRTHAGGKLGRNYKYACKLCNKNFKSLFTFSCHERIHNGEKPYICEVCNKQFTRKDHLDRHQWLHSGVKQFCCEICGKLFTERSTLNAHIVLHSGSAPARRRRRRQKCGRRDAQATLTTDNRASISSDQLVILASTKQGAPPTKKPST